MCMRGHPVRYMKLRRNENRRYCCVCQAEREYRKRHGMRKMEKVQVRKYYLRREVFRSIVPKGRRLLTLELAGIARDCAGTLYKIGTANKQRARHLCVLLRTPFHVLWNISG